MKFYAGLIAVMMVVQSWAAYPSGPSTEGNVDAAALLAWVKAHETSANVTAANAFCNQANDQDVCDSKDVTLYQQGGQMSATQPTFWQSNMDVDCDGSNSPLCSNDPSHQDQLSCNCDVANGGTVEAATTPFFVIPGCSNGCGGYGPFAYNQRGIGIGQIAAIVYQLGTKVGVAYAPFLDEDGINTEIGEGSYALNNFLGIDPNPSTGGSNDNNVAYIVFPGSANRITDYANHAHAVTVGQSAAAALLGTPVSEPLANFHSTAAIDYQISKRLISIKSSGTHSINVFSLSGENVMSMNGMGAKMYNLSQLKSGSYIVRINLESGSFADKVMIY
jgi:hypothetical protein